MELNIDTILTAVRAMLINYVVVAIAIAVLTIVAWWKLFTKAGEGGWKSLIPCVSGHVLYKIAWRPVFFWISVLLQAALLAVATFYPSYADNVVVSILILVAIIVIFVIGVMMNVKLSRAFGHGIGFAIGLALLHTLFVMILAFGSSRYVRYEKSAEASV